MKRLICLSVLTLGTLLLCTAQEPRNGTLKLKSGIEVRGAIKENKSASNVEITTTDGDIFIYNTHEIKRISYPVYTAQHGFQSSVSISGGSNFNDLYNISVDYIAGMRFNDHYFLGAGTGINLSLDSYSALSIPLYAHFRTYFLRKSKVQPFVAASVGGLFIVNEYYTQAPPVRHFLFMAEPSVGLNFRTSWKTSVYFNIGCLINQIQCKPQDYLMEYSPNFHLGFTF